MLTFFAVSHWSLLRAAGQPLASANENTVFPESVWQTATPEEVGMDSAKVAQALATLPEPAVVIRHGKIIASKGDITRPGYIWSASKSLVALIAARLIQQGYITLDTPVPESNDPDGPLATYRQFLSMTSDYRLPPRSPGDHYAYNNGAVVHYANQIKSQYFPDKSEIDMLKEAYLNTIGFEDSLDYTWYMSGWGGGWSMSTRDIARVAYLVLRDGRWKEQQILPESFVHDLFVNQIPEH
ncbi:MAG TPA: serine hydrolase, partial [Blastocatellia bacterium]|nr:serine hydrolase [Blastocatellia bacterium]